MKESNLPDADIYSINDPESWVRWQEWKQNDWPTLFSVVERDDDSAKKTINGRRNSKHQKKQLVKMIFVEALSDNPALHN